MPPFIRPPPRSPLWQVRIGRDRLGVKSTPSFFFFRNGKEFHRHSGASQPRFEDALTKALRGEDTGGGPGSAAATAAAAAKATSEARPIRAIML